MTIPVTLLPALLTGLEEQRKQIDVGIAKVRAALNPPSPPATVRHYRKAWTAEEGRLYEVKPGGAR